MGKPKARELADLSDLARPGAEIAVRVTPSAAYNAVLRDGAQIRVLVTVAPEDGKATAAVRALLAQALRLPPRAVSLKRGAVSRDKVFVLDL